MVALNRPVVIATYHPANQSGTIQYLKAIEARVRIDERAIPLYIFEARVAMPSAAAMALLDPAAGAYVSFGSRYVSDPTGYKFDYSWAGLVAGTTQNDDGTLSITAVSADQRLLEYSPTAVDKACRGLQSDVRLIWSYVLNKVYGASGWKPASPVAGTDVPLTPFPTYRAVTNMLPDGGFEYGTAGYTAVNATIGRSSSIKHGGTYALTMTGANGGGTPRAEVTANLQPGQQYTMSGWFRLSGSMPISGIPADSRKLTVAASINGVQYTLARSNQLNNDTTWTPFRFTFTMPPLADAGSTILRFVHGPTSSQSTVTSYWDDLLLVEGDGLDTDGVTPVPFFNGDTVDGTAGYNYDWQGDAGGSASTRTPVIARDQDVLTWSPGQTAYDFLQPIMEAFGYRTVAAGFLSTNPNQSVLVPQLYFVNSAYVGNLSGILQVGQGRNLYSLDTGQSRGDTFPDGTPLFADAVVIKYTWTDTLGVEQTAYDVYAPAGYTKPYYLEVEGPFAGPGPGRAQSLYNRLVARRRTYRVSYRLGVIGGPGMQVAITSDQLPSPVLGQADTVEHDLVNGITTITTKNTVAYPASGWLRLPAGESWNASPTGASWTAETIS